jgi:hypothetical protein
VVTATLKNTQVVLAHNGRYAIMARTKEGEPWVQIESVLDIDTANNFAQRLETLDEERAEYIAEGKSDEDWGDHAPATEVR